MWIAIVVGIAALATVGIILAIISQMYKITG
jgi:hypothetical protein